MSEYFTELIGKSIHKPFECVGSVDEVNLAVSMAIRRREQSKEKLPLLFEYYRKNYYNPEKNKSMFDTASAVLTISRKYF